MRRPSSVILLGCIATLLYCVLNGSLWRRKEKEEEREEPSVLAPFRLIDLEGFTFKLLPRPCGERVRMSFIVHSEPGDWLIREAIRKSWGRAVAAQRTVFLVGIAPPAIQSSLEKESGVNDDILQGNVWDSYRNLTYKHVMGLAWLRSQCPSVAYVVKADSDVFIDVLRLQEMINGGQLHMAGKSFACRVYKRMYAERNTSSKWYVSPDEYRPVVYPQYCSGSAYVTQMDTVSSLVDASTKTNYFWIEDVFVTGILADRVGAHHVAIPGKYSFEPLEVRSWLHRVLPSPREFLVAHIGKDDVLIQQLHRKAVWCARVRCDSYPFFQRKPSSAVPKFNVDDVVIHHDLLNPYLNASYIDDNDESREPLLAKRLPNVGSL